MDDIRVCDVSTDDFRSGGDRASWESGSCVVVWWSGVEKARAPSQPPAVIVERADMWQPDEKNFWPDTFRAGWILVH